MQLGDGISLPDMDVIFWGMFNKPVGTSNFVRNLQHMARYELPDWYDIKLTTTRSRPFAPPTLRDVADAVPPERPLAFLSLLGDFLKPQLRQGVQHIQDLVRLHNRTNVQHVAGRRYIQNDIWRIGRSQARKL